MSSSAASGASPGTGVTAESVVLKLRALAMDPANQVFIAREKGCLAGLVSFLSSNQELQVVLVAAQALLFLSSHPSNRSLLIKQPRLQARLTRLSSHLNPNLAHFASATLANLEAPDSASTHNAAFRKKSLHTTKLLLPPMQQADQVQDVENALLSVGGVVSVSVQARRSTATVYSVRQDLAGALVEALARAGFESAEILEKNSTAAAATSTRSGHAQEPQYLETNSFQARPDAVSVYADSFEESSLANRLAQQRRLERKKVEQQKQARSIFSKIGSLIW